MTLRDKLIASARSYNGVPFHHAGRDRNGVDCVGLLVCGARDSGIYVPDETSYSPIISGEYMMQRINECCVPLSHALHALAGDIVTFRIAGSEQHVALITQQEPMLIIHSYQTVGRVVEHPLDRHWSTRIGGWYRLKAFVEAGV